LRALPGKSWLLLGLAGVSFLVQLSAVTVNWVNYEIWLRDIYPTDWNNPLVYGPPAQGLGDLFNSPVFGQWQLMSDNFIAHTDLAWLWSDGNIQWLLVVFGGAVLLTTLAAFMQWWWASGPEGDERTLPSRPVRWLLPVLPLLLVGLWLGEVARNPHYGDPERGYRAIVAEACRLTDGNEALVTVAPFAYQVPMNWMGVACDEGLPVYGYAPNSMAFPEANHALERVLARHERIWFVTGGLPANDPENTVEQWLADHAYKANDRWYDDNVPFRLLDYATPRLLQDAPVTPLNVTVVGEGTSQVSLLSARLPTQARAGEALPVEIAYRLHDTNEYDLRWFVQLLRPEGNPAAELDTAPADGYTPFSALPANEELVERAGLLLPDNLPPGRYDLIAGLYNPALPDAPRLRAPDGSDFVRLGSVVVE
jgi:hypothetical protein